LSAAEKSTTAASEDDASDIEKISKHAQPQINYGKSNEAINQMAQELIEFRKGNSVRTAELQQLKSQQEEVSMQNLHLQ